MFDNPIRTPRGPLYDSASVQPMRDELTYVGFEELLTPADVDAAVRDTQGTLLVMLNSVCGCAAGSARPGITASLQNSIIPDRFVTVFAGMERDAVDAMRAHFTGYAPSSPNIALLKDGKVLFMMQRYDIEGRTAEEIDAYLRAMYARHCTRTGPSISKEKYDELEHARICGSSIPRMN
ncbi:MAG: BrxA/BrxB family bacilliredoxin [Ignavibacteriae bacterium]|nr:BrxA/BrxB family bacilliredoxin [Ignavibacteriota bacterium]